MSRSIQIRVEDDLKKKSDLLFKELGTDTTSAIRMFLTQAVANNGFCIFRCGGAASPVWREPPVRTIGATFVEGL